MDTKDAFALAWSEVRDSETFSKADSVFKYGSTGLNMSKAEIESRAAAYNGNTEYQNEGKKGTQICQ